MVDEDMSVGGRREMDPGNRPFRKPSALKQEWVCREEKEKDKWESRF